MLENSLAGHLSFIFSYEFTSSHTPLQICLYKIDHQANFSSTSSQGSAIRIHNGVHTVSRILKFECGEANNILRLGDSGLKISKVILGAMSYGTPDWQEWVLDEEKSLPLLEHAYKVGLNTWDTVRSIPYIVSSPSR